jgi:hypothetical protein
MSGRSAGMGYLKAVKGTASDVRQARITIISNGWRDDTYECFFRLSGEPVALSVSGPIYIEEGETVIVIGAFNRNGIFEASAYHNLSAGVSGKSGQDGFNKLQGGLLALFGMLVLGMQFFLSDFIPVGVTAIVALAFVLCGLIVFVRSRSLDRTIDGLLEEALIIVSATETSRTKK